MQTRISRARHFAVEKATTTVHGARPSAWIGRLKGPRVLANSIPKSGTHLLTRALYRCPWLHSPAGRVLRGWERIEEKTLKRLSRLQRGEFVAGHLPAHEALLELAERMDLRVLLMIRDPRDIMISYSHYVSGMDSTHPAHEMFHAMNGRDRLAAMIDGVPGVVSPMHEVLTRFAGWLDCEQALILRFEDLVGAHGGGHNGVRNAKLEQMLTFLGIPSTPERIAHITKGLYSTRSLTYRKPRIAQWRTQFDDALLSRFEDSVGDLARRFGYG